VTRLVRVSVTVAEDQPPPAAWWVAASVADAEEAHAEDAVTLMSMVGTPPEDTSDGGRAKTPGLRSWSGNRVYERQA